MGDYTNLFKEGYEITSDKSKPISEAIKEENDTAKRKIRVSVRLRATRKESGLTQTEAAEKLGIKKTTFCGYENGKSEPNMEVLVKLADLYKVSLDYLMCRTDTRVEFDKEQYEAEDKDRQQIKEQIAEMEKKLEELKKAVK